MPSSLLLPLVAVLFLAPFDTVLLRSTVTPGQLSGAPQSQLRLRVTDEHGRPIWARLEVRGPGGKMHHPPGAFHESMTKARGGEPYYLGSFIMQGAASMEVPDGRSFITNGPILFFRTRLARGRLTAFVEARAREPIDRMEIVANGQVLKRFAPAAGSRSFQGEFAFDPRNHSWVLARCFLKPGVTIRLAQSSPVYLPGKWDARLDAQYYVKWIDGLIALVAGDPQREQLLSLYRRARAFYEAKAR